MMRHLLPWALLAAVFALILLPIVVISFHPPVSENAGFSAALEAAVMEPQARRALTNSMIVGIAVGSAALPLSAALALALRRHGQRYLVLAALSVCLLLPGEVSGIAWGAASKWVIDHSHGILAHSLSYKFALITVSQLAWALPFTTSAALIGLRAIPSSVWRSAEELGARPRVVLQDVLFPLWWPALLSTFLFGVLVSFNEYTRASYLSGPVQLASEYMYGKLMSGSSPDALGLAYIGILLWVAATIPLGLRRYVQGPRNIRHESRAELFDKSEPRSRILWQQTKPRIWTLLRLPCRWWSDYFSKLLAPRGWKLAVETFGVAFAVYAVLRGVTDYYSLRLQNEVSRSEQAYRNVIEGLAADDVTARMFAVERVPDLMDMQTPVNTFPSTMDVVSSLITNDVERQYAYRTNVASIVFHNIKRFRGKELSTESAMELEVWLKVLGQIGYEGWYGVPERLWRPSVPSSDSYISWIWIPAPLNSTTPDPTLMFEEVNFSTIDLSGRSLVNARIRGAQFRESFLIATRFEGACLVDTDFWKADMVGVQAARSQLDYARFDGAVMHNGDLSRTHGRGVSFVYVEAHSLRISDAVLDGADFRRARLMLADARHSALQGADFSEANLSEANLHGADLLYANFYKTILLSANLTLADLRFADLRQADLTSADFFRANLRGADLTGANLENARYLTMIFDWTDVDITDVSGISDAMRKMMISRGAIDRSEG